MWGLTRRMRYAVKAFCFSDVCFENSHLLFPSASKAQFREIRMGEKMGRASRDQESVSGERGRSSVPGIRSGEDGFPRRPWLRVNTGDAPPHINGTDMGRDGGTPRAPEIRPVWGEVVIPLRRNNIAPRDMGCCILIRACACPNRLSKGMGNGREILVGIYPGQPLGGRRRSEVVAGAS